MVQKRIIIILLCIGAVTGCQADLEGDRYCGCRKIADEARASIGDLNLEIQEAESKSSLKRIWKEYKEEIGRKDEAMSACLLEFQRIEDEVKKLYEVEIVFNTNATEILFLLESSGDTPISLSYIKERSRVLTEEFEKVIERTRDDRERLCTEPDRQ